MTKNYIAVSQITGETFKRTTASRTYTHAVVHHVKARPADENWHERPAYAKAEWRGSLRLAEQCANQWRGRDHVTAVEILSAAEIVKATVEQHANYDHDGSEDYENIARRERSR